MEAESLETKTMTKTESKKRNASCISRHGISCGSVVCLRQCIRRRKRCLFGHSYTPHQFDEPWGERREQMKKLFVVTFMAGLVAAQSANAGQQNMPADKAQKPRAADKGSMKPTTITGCVAESGTVYRLDHAMVAVDIDTDTQNRQIGRASCRERVEIGEAVEPWHRKQMRRGD